MPVKEPVLAGGFTRRGACPALSAPMKTGDGLLVRLNPVAGGLSPDALTGLCEAALAHGNGIIEVTARGSIQIRGLSEHSAVPFAEAVTELGIAVHTGVPVQTGVLAGLDPTEVTDPTRLVESLRTAIAGAGLEGRLGPKVSVVVDGGGRTALDEVAADVRLTAVSGGWRVAIAGHAQTARPLAVAGSDDLARDRAITLLSGIAEMGRRARGRDLNDEELGAEPSSAEYGSRPSAPRTLIGNFDLRDGRLALGIGLPFGQTFADVLKTFCEAAISLGIEDIGPAPGRSLVAICESVKQMQELRERARMLGFITGADDPRCAISACPGAPDCASGHIEARKMATAIAREYRHLFDGSLHMHLSGCAKGCAHPAPSDITLVGTEGGMALVLNGTARDEAVAFADHDGAGRAFASMAALLAAQRKPREPTAQVLARIEPAEILEAFRKHGS
ncbi:MAG: precorrin-3B synthase [Rhizobiaceae bacterium]|nr:precorrin-3B synthase [Rhizobiaceae bacterium]